MTQSSGNPAECERLRQRIAELEKEREGWRVDALRYRNILKNKYEVGVHYYKSHSGKIWLEYHCGARLSQILDDEIDAAMLHTSRESNP